MPRLTRLIPLLLGLTLAGAANLPAQTDDAPPAPTIAEQMDRLFFEWNRLDRPGGSVAVVRDGEVIFQKSYGLASLEHAVPNTDRTLYDAVALAEPLTATAVARLVAEGQLSLDDDIRTYLPELPAHDQPIRIRHLLHHSSGLWDWSDAWQLSGGHLEDVITSAQILDLLARQPAPAFVPGSRTEHSVSNYTLLAEIVTRVTEESFRDWIWGMVLRPTGMIHSLVRDYGGESIEGSAEAYTYRPRRGYRRGSLNLVAPGAHGFYSSISNMATWLIGLTDADDLLEEDILNDGTPAGYVHGMQRDIFRGLARYHVEGQWQGFNSAFQYFPEQRFGVVILSNWVSGWVNPVSQAGQIVNVYLSEEIAAAASAPTPTVADEPTGFVADLSGYDQLTGDYRWEPGEVFGLILQRNQLAFQQGRNILPMSELAPDRFLLDAFPYYFTFRRDDEGRAAECLIEFEGEPDVTAVRIELADPGPEQLAALTGEYYSPELDVSYSVLVRDDTLVLAHSRRGETRLTPEAVDYFQASAAPFRLLEFVRDDAGRVVGFEMDTMNLCFRKRD